MGNLSTTAALSGTVYFSNGKPAAGKSVIIKRVQDTSGNLISSDHTLYKTNLSGQFNATVPRNSYVWIYSDVDGFNSKNIGSVVYVGNSASYELETLTANINYPELIPVAGGGGGASTFVELSDVPTSYVGYANKYVAVKTDESGLEFVAGVTTATLTSYVQTASLTAYATTGHSHSQYATSASLTGYVNTTSNQTIYGAKTFDSIVKSNGTPTDATDLISKSYLETQLSNLPVLTEVLHITTNSDTPYDTSLAGTLIPTHNTVGCAQVLLIGKLNGNINEYYVSRFDLVGLNIDGNQTISLIYPQYEYSTQPAVGGRVITTGVEYTLSLTGHPTETYDWYFYTAQIAK